MPNPFQEAGPVRGDAFCDRDVELERVLESIERGGGVLVEGAGGAGTSSFLLRIRDRLVERGWTVPVMDLWRADGASAVADELAAATVELATDRKTDATTEHPSGGGEEGLEAALDALRERAGASDRRVALVVDEADRVKEIDDDVAALESLLELSTARTSGGERVAVVLGGGELGSDLETSLGSSGTAEPLRVRLGPIPFEAWLPFVLERFLVTDRWIENRHVERIFQITQGHPARTQAVLHALWDQVERNTGTQDGEVDRAVKVAVRRRGQGYALLWRTLTRNQRRVLRGLALDGPGARPYSSAFIRRHRLASPSSAQRALQALEDLRVVTRTDDEGPRIEDLFLRRWLRERSSAGSNA
ncbi:MAG: AAA family ATPase [Gemmatimonadota bacterium]